MEIPIGLGTTTLILGFVAIANLFTKQIATIYGIAFTLVLFVLFTISDRVNECRRRRQHLEPKPLEEFNLDHQQQVNAASIHARPGCMLVAARDYHNMEHLRKVLQKTNLRKHDIVVMTVRTISTGAGEYDLVRRPDLQRLRAGVVQPRGRARREGRQTGGACWWFRR